MKLGENQTFSSPGEALEHHGVKGMRWGIRKKRETQGERTAEAVETAANNESTKAYMAASIKANREAKPSEANFVKNHDKFMAKFEEDEANSSKTKSAPKSHHLTPTQKKLLIGAGIGAGTVAGLYFVSKYRGANGSPMSFDFLNKPIPEYQPKGHDKPFDFSITQPRSFSASYAPARSPKPAWAEDLVGKPIDADKFNGLVALSQGNTWSRDQFVDQSSYAREAFELPAGHVFHRLSTTAETEFTKPTYSVSNIEDWNRYLTNFRQEKTQWNTDVEFHHVKWKSTAPIRVPALPEVLGSLHKAMIDEAKESGYASSYHKQDITPQMVVNEYQKLSGSGWSSPHAKRLVSDLKQKGYGAVIDEMDAGVIGEKPLVFFSDAVTKKESSKLSTADLSLAESKLIEITNRKL